MYKRVFKQKGSRVFRVRYKLSDGPKIYDEPLKTHLREVAEVKARQLIDEREKELAGLLGPKSLREASQTDLKQHCADFVASMIERNRGRAHVVHVRCRLQRLVKECRWHLLRDVTVESFVRWRTRQEKLSTKTLNEYLGHANALLNWMQRQGRAGANPLKAVSKLARKDMFNRRALSVDELVRLVAGSGKRGLAYLMAGCTGLRRGEIKQLLWTDIHLESPQPFIDVRAETTKSKKAALIPIIPALAETLCRQQTKRRHFSGRVFPHGLPSVASLAKDLTACGIAVEDARGFRVDFHALRHTFASLLATAGVSELARVKLARHSEWRQTDRYTDSQSLPLFTEMEKFGASLPSSIASPKSGKMGQYLSKLDPPDDTEKEDKIIPITSHSTHLGKAVPSWESVEMVPKGGLEPQETQQPKSFIKRALSCL